MGTRVTPLQVHKNGVSRKFSFDSSQLGLAHGPHQPNFNSWVSPVDLTIHLHLTRISMPAKRKKKTRVPLRSHHPSQSSIDVPVAVKTLVKDTQDKRCWLCNRKAHKSHRPLEICHIFPQAMSKRYNVTLSLLLVFDYGLPCTNLAVCDAS